MESRNLALRSVVVIMTTFFAMNPLAKAERTVGLLQHSGQDLSDSTNYRLFPPLNSTSTYLIDADGRQIRNWESEFQPGNSAYLLDDGSLLRAGKPPGNADFIAGGQAGQVERFNWEGELEWSFRYSETGLYKSHHDIQPLPNGNVLILAWEMKSEQECLAVGREPGTLQFGELWPEHVIEVMPTGSDSGEIVWEWHIWDHLIQDHDPLLPNYGQPMDYPNQMDINYSVDNNGDWLHANAIHYNPELDQIMLSLHRLGEIWIIDHNTTTTQAAGPAGDLLYRWGNPQVYNRDADDSHRTFFGQHDARWIQNGQPGHGNIMVFNNGQNRPEGNYTTIDEFTPPLLSDGTYQIGVNGMYGPEDVEIAYIADPPSSFYASFISGAERLANGNTLICSGPWGDFFEVTPSGQSVWVYKNPVTSTGILSQGELPDEQGTNSTNNRTFRCSHYASDFVGFEGKDMTPSLPIETYMGPCLADLDGDDGIGVNDLLLLLNAWGTGAGDIQGDGKTNVDDILLIIGGWGSCL